MVLGRMERSAAWKSARRMGRICEAETEEMSLPSSRMGTIAASEHSARRSLAEYPCVALTIASRSLGLRRGRRGIDGFLTCYRAARGR